MDEKILGRFNFFSTKKDSFCVAFYADTTHNVVVVAQGLEHSDAERLMRNLNHNIFDTKKLLEEFADEDSEG